MRIKTASAQPSSFFLRPKKQLGQNFLVDRNVLNKIVDACALKPDDIVLEIGAGLGHLTACLAAKVRRIIAVETDKRFCQELSNRFEESNVNVIHADFLKYDIRSLPSNMKAVGNLPYYISSAIIAKIIEHRTHFTSLFATVQLEFGHRMAAKINTKDYSAFSCFIQYYTDPQLLFRIKNTSFKPAPKVDSCFMRLDMREKPAFNALDETLLFKLIHQAFQRRRKTIANALDGLIEKNELPAILDLLHIDLKARPENLSIKDFVNIANILKERHDAEKE